MARRSRIVAVASTTVLISFLGGRAEVAAQIQTASSGVAGEVRTLTALVGPSSDEVLLSVPPDSNFLVTQVCRSGAGSDFRLHNVAGGGANSQVTLDNTECQEYTPGLVYVGGDDVVFRNNNATISVRVAVNGILTKK